MPWISLVVKNRGLGGICARHASKPPAGELNALMVPGSYGEELGGGTANLAAKEGDMRTLMTSILRRFGFVPAAEHCLSTRLRKQLGIARRLNRASQVHQAAACRAADRLDRITDKVIMAAREFWPEAYTWQTRAEEERVLVVQ